MKTIHHRAFFLYSLSPFHYTPTIHSHVISNNTNVHFHSLMYCVTSKYRERVSRESAQLQTSVRGESRKNCDVTELISDK